jgi:hypothetical protein
VGDAREAIGELSALTSRVRTQTERHEAIVSRLERRFLSGGGD